MPSEVCLLRGHGGGVTCLSLSPNDRELLSGGKDQVLLVRLQTTAVPGQTQNLDALDVLTLFCTSSSCL